MSIHRNNNDVRARAKPFAERSMRKTKLRIGETLRDLCAREGSRASPRHASGDGTVEVDIDVFFRMVLYRVFNQKKFQLPIFLRYFIVE